MKTNSLSSIPVIETERLLLREITVSDAESVFCYLSDPLVMQYYGMAPFTHVEQAVAEIDWYQQNFQQKGGIRWGISLKDEGMIIGSCGFHLWDRQHAQAEIGYELHRDYWKQGIAFEALTAMIRYSFTYLHIKRIQAWTAPENSASRKQLHKLGFVEEEFVKDYEFTKGEYYDLYRSVLYHL